MDFLNDLLKNHPLESETEFSIDRYLERAIGETETEVDPEYLEQLGGGKTIGGGFPPIIICKSIDTNSDTALLIDKNNKDEKKKRAFESNKSSVKLKDIMEQRKNSKPFFRLD